MLEEDAIIKETVVQELKLKHNKIAEELNEQIDGLRKQQNSIIKN